MPTNVPPQYREAEARYRAAVSPEDKLAALEEMLRIMPKHKGTDKLQADVKARIAKLRQHQEGPRKGGGHSHVIAGEGAGQVALVGPPNVGKSSLVSVLTGAEPKVADYPYTTIEPVPGMMPVEDVFVQLIDLPAISTEHVEPWVFDLVRRADILWIVVESGGALDGLESIRSLLAAKHIEVYPQGGSSAAGGDPAWVRKPGMLVVTGMDRPGAADNLEILRALLEAPWPVHAVSPVNGHGLEALGRETFEALDVIRIYTKEPGKPADRKRPFTLPRGATVADLAETIHRELAQGLKFARIWGEGVFDGQQVQRDHVLAEGNVVELHLM